MVEFKKHFGVLQKIRLLKPEHKSDAELIITVPSRFGRNPFTQSITRNTGGENRVIIDDPDITKLGNCLISGKDKVLLYGEHRSGKSECAWLAAQRYLYGLKNKKLVAAMIDLEGDRPDLSSDDKVNAYIRTKVEDILSSANVKEKNNIGVVVLDEISAWGDIDQVVLLLTRLEKELSVDGQTIPIIATVSGEWSKREVGKQNNPFNVWMQKLGFTTEQIAQFFQQTFHNQGFDFKGSQEFKRRLFTWMADQSDYKVGVAHKIGFNTYGILATMPGQQISLEVLKSRVAASLLTKLS